jgi:hypothetical protein
MGFVEVPLGSRIDRDLAEWDEGLAGLAGSAGPFQPFQAGREGSNAGKSSLTMRHHRPGRPTGHQPRSIVPSGPPQALPMPLHSIQPSLHMNHACHMQRELLCLVESGGRLPGCYWVLTTAPPLFQTHLLGIQPGGGWQVDESCLAAMDRIFPISPPCCQRRLPFLLSSRLQLSIAVEHCILHCVLKLDRSLVSSVLHNRCRHCLLLRSICIYPPKSET